jgi:hypothetical protein
VLHAVFKGLKLHCYLLLAALLHCISAPAHWSCMLLNAANCAAAMLLLLLLLRQLDGVMPGLAEAAAVGVMGAGAGAARLVSAAVLIASSNVKLIAMPAI